MRLVPRSVDSDGDLAVELAAGYGLVADDWQADELDGWLGRRRDGRWSAATCGLAVPRQNGKNGVIEVRELYGMVELGEKFLHTAHEVKTARKAFLRVASFFENDREFPELAGLVKEIRKTNGQEAVVLSNGGSVEFIARSRGSGRGFTVDVLVCDEAQDLIDEELAALLPTISAAPLGNPQVVLTGTPPDPEKDRGDVWRRVRADGEAGRDLHLCWSDWGVPDGPLPDVDDRVLWQRVNPALGGRLNVAEVVRERALMSAETFAAERLGWWGNPQAAVSLLDVVAWRGLLDESPQWVGGVAFGVTVSPDRKRSVVGVAGYRADGAVQVEVVAVGSGTAWLPAWLEQRTVRWGPVAVVLDGTASSLELPLVERGVPVVLTSTRDRCQGTVGFFDAVQAGHVRHNGEPVLDGAVAAAGKRDLTDGWVWDGPLVGPLQAVTLAHLGLVSSVDPRVPSPAPKGSPAAAGVRSETSDLVTAGF